jgi:PAS domain S-box-containing protein
MSKVLSNNCNILFNYDLQIESLIGNTDFLISRQLVLQLADKKTYIFDTVFKQYASVLLQTHNTNYCKLNIHNTLYSIRLLPDSNSNKFSLEVQELIDLDVFNENISVVFQNKTFWEAVSNSMSVLSKQFLSCNVFIFRYIEDIDTYVFFKEVCESEISGKMQVTFSSFKSTDDTEPDSSFFEQYIKEKEITVLNLKIDHNKVACLCIAIPKGKSTVSQDVIYSFLRAYETVFCNAFIRYKYILLKYQQNLIGQVSKILHAHKIDEFSVQSALQKIGETLQIERVVLHTWDPANFETILFCEWHTPQLQPLRLNFAKYNKRSAFYQMLQLDKILDQTDVQYYEIELYKLLKLNNIESILMVPTKQNGVISGVFAFGYSIANRLFKEDYEWSIFSLGNMLSGNVIFSRQKQQSSLSEKKFRELSMQIPGVSFQLTYISGKPWKFNFVNRRIKEYFGIDFVSISDEELVSEIISHVHPDDRHRFIDSAQKSIDNQTEWYFEGRAFNDKGKIIWIEGHASVTPYAGYVISNGVIFEISDRKESEQALKISNARLNTLLLNIKVGIIMTNNESKPIFVNTAFLSLFGFDQNIESFLIDKTSLLRKTTAKMKDKRQYLLRLSEMGTKKEAINSDVVELHNGLFIEYGYVPVFENNEWLGHLWFFHDVTNRIRYEQELINAKNIAENSEKTKSLFLASMSHELRTPLNGILGCSDAILDVCEDSSIKHLASIIEMSGRRLLSSLNAILDMTALQAGKLTPVFESFNLNELIEDHIYLFRHRAEKQKLYLNLVADSEFRINSDSKILNKILDNLTSNAIKFTHNGGITIFLDKVERDNQVWAEIKVADTGIGISEKFKKQIFEPFRQISEGYKREFDGSGLGLSLTLQYLDLLGGSISLESEEGKGSTFIVLIPDVPGEVII